MYHRYLKYTLTSPRSVHKPIHLPHQGVYMKIYTYHTKERTWKYTLTAPRSVINLSIYHTKERALKYKLTTPRSVHENIHLPHQGAYMKIYHYRNKERTWIYTLTAPRSVHENIRTLTAPRREHKPIHLPHQGAYMKTNKLFSDWWTAGARFCSAKIYVD